MSRFAVLVMCLVVLSVPVLAACGSDNKKKVQQPAPAQIARLKVLSKANNVCIAANAVTDPVQPKTVDDISKAINTMAPAASAELAALRSLTPPADLHDNWNRMLQLMQGQITLMGQVKTATDSGLSDRQIAGLIKLLNEASREGQQRAVAMGLPNCGT